MYNTFENEAKSCRNIGNDKKRVCSCKNLGIELNANTSISLSFAASAVWVITDLKSAWKTEAIGFKMEGSGKIKKDTKTILLWTWLGRPIAFWFVDDYFW